MPSPAGNFFGLFRRKRKTALESVRRKRREEALAWGTAHYRDKSVGEIAARLVLVLEDQINVPISQYLPQTRFLEDLGMTDLEPVEVILAVEEEFNVPEIDSRVAERMRTIDDMIRYLAACVAEKPDC